MQSIKIRRRLNAPIPEIPEISGLVGKNVEITVVEEPDTAPTHVFDFWKGPSAVELAAQQGVGPVRSLDQLHGEADSSTWFDGFDETLGEWRSEPSRSGEE